MAYFTDLLKEAGLSKSELAIHLGVKNSTISSWSGSPPQYAIWGLQNYIAALEYREFQTFIKRASK